MEKYIYNIFHFCLLQVKVTQVIENELSLVKIYLLISVCILEHDKKDFQEIQRKNLFYSLNGIIKKIGKLKLIS